MAKKIKISDHIIGLHRKPIELSSRTVDETLVIMSHGFPGHKSAHNDMFGDVEFLIADKGFHSLRFDYRGCGESAGTAEHFTMKSASEDFQTVLFWAREHGYKRFVYIGEGLGATLAIQNHDLDVICRVMLWPALDLQEYRHCALKITEVSEDELAKGYVEYDRHRYGIDFLKELKKDALITPMRDLHSPVLIMHGAEDDKIPVGCLDLARAHMHSKRIEITTFHDGGHGLKKLNHRKSMFYHMQQFLEKYI